MIVHEMGVVEYREAMESMRQIHRHAVEDGGNHLIVCSHPKIFTVGRDDKREWPVPVCRTDRGGSITCHSEGQAVLYFCFQAPNPALFFRRVLEVYDRFFESHLPPVRYEKRNPGYYIKKRKIASLGFRYSRGVSQHGVALNVDVDLSFHRLVAPCGIDGIEATSLRCEGVDLSMKEAEESLIDLVCEVFGESDEA